MKLSIQTRTGVSVTLSPTYFVDDCQHPRDATLRLLAPVMQVDGRLLAGKAGKRAFSTSFLCMQDQHSRFGVFFIIAGNHLTALIADLRNPLIRRWQEVAEKHGYLPMLLQLDSATSLLEYPWDEGTATAFATPDSSGRSNIDSTERAVGAIISLADSIEALPNLLPDQFRLESMRVHLVASEVAAPKTLLN